MIELEKTYLLKFLPEGLRDSKSKEIIDVYLPKNSVHPKLRLRKNGNKFELTKKTPVQDGDASRQTEQTIVLSEEEFNDLNSQLDGKRIHKIRYYYNYNGRTAEIDVFQDDLQGLILVDVEFDNLSERDGFAIPDFCLAEVTQELFIAGGMLCGKNYTDIEGDLEKFNYKSLSF